jgi:hypothetical protein
VTRLIAVPRLIILCARPYHLTADDAAAWIQHELQRLLDAHAISHAELTHVQTASARHPAGCHWMLELHLKPGLDARELADEPPCADWLSDLRQLGMQPIVMLADGGTIHRANQR